MPRKNSNAVFLQLLNGKSDRDVARELKMSRDEISAIDQRSGEQTKVVEETSTKLTEAKKLVEELQAKLTDTQTSLKNDEKRKKMLTKQADAMEKHLESKREATEKDAYVKRCIKYLFENGDDYIDKVSQHTPLDLSFLDGEYTEEDLETLSDNDVIELAHLTRVCEIFEEVKDKIKNPLWQWEFDKDYIYFSEQVGCNGNTSDSCCHKRYAYVFDWNWADVVSYKQTVDEPFRIDTPVKDTYDFMRVN